MISLIHQESIEETTLLMLPWRNHELQKNAMERNEHKKKTPQDTLDAFRFVDVITNSKKKEMKTHPPILRFAFKVVGKKYKIFTKLWFNGDLPWYKVIKHLKQIQEYAEKPNTSTRQHWFLMLTTPNFRSFLPVRFFSLQFRRRKTAVKTLQKWNRCTC